MSDDEIIAYYDANRHGGPCERTKQQKEEIIQFTREVATMLDMPVLKALEVVFFFSDSWGIGKINQSEFRTKENIGKIIDILEGEREGDVLALAKETYLLW